MGKVNPIRNSILKSAHLRWTKIKSKIRCKLLRIKGFSNWIKIGAIGIVVLLILDCSLLTAQTNKYYTIQIGCYRKEKNAQKCKEELKQKGVDARVVEAVVSGSTYYRVWVGQFPTIDEAKVFVAKLDSLGIKGHEGHIVLGSNIKPYEETNETSKPAITTNPPKLTFDYSLLDENQNKILDGGEEVSLKVTVRNQGKGVAQGVKVLFSGESKALNYLGREKYIGDIPAGSEKEAVFEAVLPYQIEADEGDIVIKVTEERGFGSLEVKKLRVAMQPAKEEVVEDVVSVLVDVDQPLNPTSFRREDAYAVIIGITDYRSAKIPKVKYAKRDAEMMKEYLVNVCGIPSENIMMLTDDKAALSDLTAYIEEWLQRNVSKNSFVFVYFAGHGTPNPEKGDAYLVPYDGEPGFISKLYPLSRFYNSLEQLPTENIIVALDACFSGAGGRSVMEGGKRPLVPVKIPQVTKKVAVITASDADEISQDLDTKRHGLFTYYFLKGLRGEADADGDNWVTLGELYNYCKPKIAEESKKLGYTQTIQVLPKPLGEKIDLKIGKMK